MKIRFIIALSFVLNALIAQPYAVENGNTRHRFAQLELGVTQYYSPNSGTTQILQDGKLYDYKFGGSGVTALYIGATHFWGHCDMALTIPIARYGGKLGYGVDLQMKYYPKRIEQNKLRPYIGVSMNPLSYGQNDGGTVSKTIFPLLAGLNYFKNNHQFELGVVYNYQPKLDYYISRNQIGQVNVLPLTLGVTYKYTLETTGGAERNWRNGTTSKLTKELGDEGKLNTLSVAVGPTSSFRIKSSSYLSEKYPFAGQKSYGASLEYGLGYYLHKPDLQFNIAHRTFKSEISAYGYTEKTKRTATTFEVFKFLGDYHGFKPFIGSSVGYENLSVTEGNKNQATQTYTFKGFKPGLTFGWDIMPDRLQKWTLRTNLRWQPNLNVTMGDGRKNVLDQLEFNFIQLVVFPHRFFIKELKKK
jgi:outer membrane protein W